MELLAPCGNYLSALAALNAGADAIYLGGKNYSARMSADNFSNEEMIEIINHAHLLNKKVYVTMNTLILQDEFFDAVDYAEFLYRSHVDAIIVQDIGFAFYLSKVLPGLELHASTQLNCHNLKQAEALKKVGFKRVVLARESPLSLAKEIKQLGLEVEVFIHGALCVSYSGNCLMSSFIGNRSGNRGRCAQPCRLKYTICNDSQSLSEDIYALSTKDLNTIDYVKDYIRYDIDSLKIEGRLKQSEYVFLTVLSYRHSIDSYINNVENNNYHMDLNNLKSIFSRKFTKGYVFNESPLNLLNQASSSHQGEEIGQVVRIKNKSVFIRLNQKIHRLDGIRFNDEKQYGRQIGTMYVNGKPIDYAYKNQEIELRHIEIKIAQNCKVIRTSSYELLKDSQEKMKQNIKLPLKAKIIAFINKPLMFEVSDGKNKVSLSSDIVESALNKGTSNDRIIEQFKKTGNYPFVFSSIDYKGSDNIFIPISSINSLRNKVLDLYITNKLDFDYQERKPYDVKLQQTKMINKPLIVLNCKVRNDEFSTYEYNDGDKNITNRINEVVNLTSKNNIVHSLIIGDNLIASSYCNITNSYSLDAYFSFGFNECCLSYELSYDLIKMVIDDFKTRHGFNANVSVPVYGYFDMMIMKSCPVATYFKCKSIHCGKCHKQQLYLKDRVGVKFPIYGDDNCTFHVLSDKPLYLIDKIMDLKKIGVQHFYLNFTIESKNEIDEIIHNAISNLTFVTSMFDSIYTRGHFSRRVL